MWVEADEHLASSDSHYRIGKIAKGLSGVVVESLSAQHGLMMAYRLFFVGAGAIGIPAILLFLALSAHHRRQRLAVS